MYQEDTSQSQNIKEPDMNEGGAPQQPEKNVPETITRIADLQRMNIEQLTNYARTIGLKNLGALTRSQIVFEVVKCLSERPNEVLVGEGVLEVLPDGFGFLRSP